MARLLRSRRSRLVLLVAVGVAGVGGAVAAGEGSQPAQTYWSTVAADLPVAQFQFADGAGSSTIADSAGSYTAANTGITLGGAGPFPGSDSGVFGGSAYAALPSDPLAGVSAFTAEAWVYWSGGSSYGEPVFDFGSSGSNQMVLTPASSAASHPLSFEIRDSAGQDFLVTGPTLASTTWEYVTVTETSAGVLTLYVDGVQVGQTTGVSISPSSLGSLGDDWLGQSVVSGTAGFNGALSNVAFYTSALPAARVLAHYNAAEFPVNSSAPTVSGTAQDGQTLTASAGSWTGLTPFSYGYQWQSCNSAGGDCSPLSGATGATFGVGHGQVGTTLEVGVTATNSAGSGSATSPATGVVAALAPSNTALPVVSGTATDGQTLSVSNGTWNGTPTIAYTYQWQLCNSAGGGCSNISGATGSSFTLGAADVGGTVVAVVTATNAGGSAGAASAATGTVAAGDPAPFNTCDPDPLPSPSPGSAANTIIIDGQMTAVGQEANYASLANAQTTVAFRSVAAPIPNYNTSQSFAYTPVSSNSQVQYWQANNYPFYFTVASSGFPGAGLPLMIGECAGDAALRMSEDQGLYIDGLVTYDAALNGWNWTAGVGAITTAQWQTLNYWVQLAAVLNKKVIWSEPAQGWQALLANSTAQGYFKQWGSTLVPMFATNFDSESAGYLMGTARSAAVQAANTYGMDLGESIQSWWFRDQTDVGEQKSAGLPTSGAKGTPPTACSNSGTTGYELDPLNTDSYQVSSTCEGDPQNGTLTQNEPGLVPSASATLALANFGAQVGATYYEVEGTNGSYQVAAGTHGSYPAVNDMAWPTLNNPSPVMAGIQNLAAQLQAGTQPPANITTTPLYQLWDAAKISHYYTTTVNSSGDPLGPSGGTTQNCNSNPTTTYCYQNTPAGATVVPAGYVATGHASGTVAWYEYAKSSTYYYSTSSGTPSGYTAKGIVGYVMSSEQPGTEPLYQAYEPSYDGYSDYFYTTDAAYQRPNALGSFYGYQDQGVNSYLFSYPSTPVALGPPPVNTALPAITGTPQDGQTLTASTGSWTGAPTITYSYQWQTCNSTGGSCTNISGATSSTDLLGHGSVGTTLRVVVTATNPAGTVPATSAATAVVAAAPPANTAAPTITGTATQGQTLTATTGTWTGTPTISYSYQWQDCNSSGGSCANITGATSSTYTLAASDVAGTVVVVVTATNAGGSLSTPSAATGTVTGLPPGNTTAPAVSGTAVQGGTLTASSGTWTGTAPVTYTYQWQGCAAGASCANITGATASTYSPVASDVATQLQVLVTATNAYGAASQTSAETPVVEAFAGGSACTDTWTGDSGDGTWENGGNWATGAAPGPADHACILTSGTVTVNTSADQAGSLTDTGTVAVESGGSLTLNGPAASSVEDLTLDDGGSLSGAGEVDVSGALDWTGGTMSGSGITVLEAGATSTITQTGSTTLTLQGRDLQNAGTLTASGVISGSDGAVIDNTGTLNVGCVFAQTGGAVSELENDGTMNDTTNGGASVAWEFENQASGTINAELVLYGGGDPFAPEAGDWAVDPMLAEGGDYQFASDSTVTQGLLVYSQPYEEVLGLAIGGSTQPASLTTTGPVNWPDADVRCYGAGGQMTVGSASGPSSFYDVTAGGCNATIDGPTSGPANQITEYVETYDQDGDPGMITVDGGLDAYSLLPGSDSTIDLTGTTETDLLGLEGGTIDQTGTASTSGIDGNGLIEGDGATTVALNSDGAAHGLQNGFLEGGPVTIDSSHIATAGTIYVAGDFTGEDGAEIDNSGAMFGYGSSFTAAGTGALPVFVNEQGGALTGFYPVGPANNIVTWRYGNRGRFDGSWQFGDPAGQRDCQFAGSVQCATGDLTESQTDLSATGLGGGLALTRTYDSQAASASDATPGIFGYGWSSSYTDSLVIDSSTGTATVDASDGSTTTFTANGYGAFIAPAWVQATLVRNGDGSYTYTTLPGRDTMTFNSSGQLTSEADQNGNTTTLAYNNLGQLASVTDAGNQTFTLTYNGSGLVASATDPTGLTVYYAYDGNGNLVEVSDSSGLDTPRWQFGYDGQHELTSLTDADGNTTTIAYDSSGRVLSETDPMGRVTAFSYTGDPLTGASTTQVTNPGGDVTSGEFNYSQPTSMTNGTNTPAASTQTTSYSTAYLPVSQTGGDGHTTTSTYDVAGNQLSTTDPDSNQTTYAYNADDQVTSQTTPEGELTTMAYDQNGNQLSQSQTNGLGQVATTSYIYNPDGTLASETDADGGTTSYTYNSQGNLASETDPDGNTTSYAYDADGRQLTETSPEGNVPVANPAAFTTTNTLDALGRVTAVTDPLGDITRTTYDPDGNAIAVTDPDNNTTTTTYDADGEVTKVTAPDGSSTQTTYTADGQLETQTNQDGQTTSDTYDQAGNLVRETGPLGSSTSYTYDAAGQKTSMTDADGNTTYYGYDPAGQLTLTTLPDSSTQQTSYTPDGQVATQTNQDGQVTSYIYDSLGRETSETGPLGRTTSYTYDPAGNKTSVTDPDGYTTTYAYDGDNQLTVTSYPDGSTLQSSYTPDGQVATQTDQDDQVTSYSYDADGHMLSETGPLDRTTSYTYDAAGNKASMTDAEGRRTSYSYNSVNELTAVSYTDGSTPDASYSYNPTGQVTMMSDGTGTSTYSYDQLGRLTGTTDGAGASVAYGYDPDGNDTSITYPNGQTVQRKFSDIGNLASVTDWLGNTTSFSYYPNRNLMQTSYPGSTDQTDSYSYNAADEQTAMSTTANSQTVASLGDTYDPDGNVLQESSTGLGDATQTYSYNNLDELTGDNSAPDAYDPDRNLTELDGQSTPMTYDAADELTSGPAGSYSHNRLGERTSQTNGATTTSYGWNQADNLTSVNGGANNLGEGYAYDANGLLQSSTSNGTTTQLTWDTNASIPLLIVDGHTNIIYGPGNLPLEQISSDNQPVYYHHDQLGSTRLLTNTNGDPLETINYSPYGTPTITSGSATTNLLFAGQYTDPNNGMVYLRARWYDPATGQFLSIDPDDSQTDAAYYYAGDNPVTESDPSGDATAAQNEQIAYDYFNGRGDLNAAAAAGIVGNLMVEDGPTACNPQGLGDPNASYCGPCSPRKCGYGIASWTGVRYDALFRVEHSSKPTLLQQLNFIWWEFTTPGASGNGAYFWLTVRSLFPSTNSVAGARADAYLFGYYYEGYSAPSTDRRLGYAAMIWRDRG